MIRNLRLFSLFALLALPFMASCSDSLPGTPFFVTPPGPNGNIIYTEGNSDDLKSEIFVIDSNGNRVTTLGPGLITSKPGNQLAAWTIVRDDFGLQTEIWESGKNGGIPSQVAPTLTNELIVHGTASINPDGKRVAFGTFGFPSQQGSLYYYQSGNGTAATPINIAKDYALNTVSAWSPDGKKLAFFKQLYDIAGDPVSGTEGFAIADIATDGSLTIQDLSSELAPFSIDGIETIDWSPNSREVLFSASGTQFRYKLGDSNPSFSSYIHGTFSPDGKRIAYVGVDNQLWTEELEGTGRTQLTFAADSVVFYPSWSPDSKYLIYTSLGRADDLSSASLKLVDVSRPDNTKLLVPSGVARGFWMTR